MLSLGWRSSPTTDHHVAPRAFQVGLICLQNKSGPWPSRYIVTHKHGAVSDLSCYITMYLQNAG